MFGHLGRSHVFQKLDGFLWSTKISSTLTSGWRAHHHKHLPGFGIEGGKRRLIFELATFDQNLLAIGLDAGKGEELVLQGLAIGGRVELDFVTLAGMLNNDCFLLVLIHRHCRTIHTY